MALSPGSRYPAQTDADPAYPQGKARNAVTFNDGTGTPLERDWLNDLWGFLQSLLANASITPSGSADEVGASQYLEGVTHIAETEAAAAAAAAEVSLSSQALKGWTRVSSTVTGSQIGAVLDTSRALALVSNGAASGTLRVRSDGTPTVAGNIAANTTCIARDPATNTMVASVGSGGNWAYRSTNFGTSWTIATTKPALGANKVVWGDATFFATDANGAVYTSPTGDVWTLRTPGFSPRLICATKDAVGAEFLLVANQAQVEVSSDSGVTWGAAGVLPDAAHHLSTTATAMASVPVGNQILPFYLANYDSGDEFRVYRATAPGGSWTHISTLPLPAAIAGDNAAVNLIGDPDTGALLAVLRSNGATKGSTLFLSLDAGLTWISNVNVDTSVSGAAMANGRVFIINTGGVCMSNYEIPLL
jgi:hypothetical protein